MTATSPSAARASLGRSPRSLSTWLDSVTARVTMYRLVLIALLVVVAAALVTSAAGLIAYEPLAILANGAAVVVATLVSNRLFALVFRVRPHTESSLVTALILLLLFQPSLTTLGVGAVALAGVIASASKYLLAVRGRHVVNPAAFAAVVISVALPAAFPGWWVGAPALLPVVLVAALVILHRTRKLPLGAVFVVVATVGVTLAGLSFGSSLSAALSAAVLSSPIVFFAGFMLTEPLTLPPRRWQQLALAVVVGVLFAVPFHFGPLYGTYELALVIGNILAFAVGQRRGVRLEFVERRRLSPSSWELSFRPTKPIRFQAGQYLELGLPHSGADTRGQRRTFSIVSPPSERDVVRFGIKTADRSSSFKTRLLALDPGERVTGTLVGGDFLLPRDESVPLLFVAGGIGITPFVSHLRDVQARSASTDAVVIYSVSTPDEAAYLDELPLGGRLRGVLLAPESPSALPAGWTYGGSGPLTADLLQSTVPDAGSRRAYVAGSPRLVSGVRRILRSSGVKRVVTDAFTGY